MTDEELIESFLLMPDGREKAKERGLEEMFDAEIEKLRKKLPHVTFRENAILGFEALARQKPVTLEEMREQVRRVSEQSISDKRKKRESKEST